MRRAALWFVLVTACGACRSPAAPDAGAGPTLVVRAMAEPAGLNVLDDAYRDAWTSRITRNTIFEALLDIDPSTYLLRPGLAVSWDQSNDQLTTTLHLRKNVVFHDGSAFSARDAVAVLDVVKSTSRHTGAVRADFVDLVRYRAVDDHTLELTWSRASPFHLRQLAKLPMMSASALAGDWLAQSRHPVGTGPFRFESWETGQRLTLVRSPSYWGPSPRLERVVFRPVKDHTVATALFERGEFDLMTFIQPSVWRSLEAAGGNQWQLLKSIDNSYSFIAWNEARPEFADVRVRRALARLYPAEQMAKNVDLGLEVPTTCPFWLPSGKCDPEVMALSFDPAAARAELVDAGFVDTDGDGVLERAGRPFRFRFVMPGTSVRLGKLAPLLQHNLEQAGVRMDIEAVDTAVLSQRVNGRDFDATSRVWTEFDSEQDLFATFHSSQIDGGSNYVGYADPETDRLLEQIRSAADAVHRLEPERALHRRLYRDQPYLFMTARQSLDAARPRVHGLKPSLLWYDLREVWLDPP